MVRIYSDIDWEYDGAIYINAEELVYRLILLYHEYV